MNTRLFKSALAATAMTAMLAATPALATTTISNTGTGGNVGGFGRPDSQTYGQVFRAPVTGILSNFSLWLNGTIEGVSGGVGTWNDTDLVHSFGHGSPTNLFLGAPLTANGQVTITPGVSVTAGQLYVAYLTVFGNAGPSGATTMQLGTANPDLGYFVWNNSSNPAGNSSWNYFFDTGNARFEATFNAQAPGVPEPSTWALMLLGFFAVGAALRSNRKPKVTTSVSYA